MFETLKLRHFIAMSVCVALSGCLEHKYNISLLRDSSVEVDYELRGDRVDLEDGQELLPDSLLWKTERSVEDGEEETTHILKGSQHISSPSNLSDLLDWKRRASDSVYFVPFVELVPKTMLFTKKHLFFSKIKARRFNELYGDIWEYVPEECRAIEDEDALKQLPTEEVKMLELKFGLGIIQWNRARYERAFDQVWNIASARSLLKPDSDQIGFSVAKAGWIEDIHIYLNSLDIGKPQTANLKWWETLKPAFISRFANLIDSSKAGDVIAIADAVELHYQISKDLEDDRFTFELSLPGFVSAGNGSNTGQVVTWEFSGKDFSNEDVELHASTTQVDYLQVFALLVIITAIYYAKRSSKGSRAQKGLSK